MTFRMSSPSNPSTTVGAAQTATQSPLPPRSDARPAFWRILTNFDASKISSHRAFRNALGVVLPLIAGFALQMPRGGLVVATGALNVSYSDTSDPYSVRARRMLASSFICAIAVFAGAISGRHHIAAIVLASLWAFVAGMLVAVGGAAPDLGVISLVTFLIYAAQPLTSHQAALSGVLALGGGLLQTALSIALWPVRRYEPERRALASLYRELANRASSTLIATSPPIASTHSDQAQEALAGLTRDPGPDSLRYRALLTQAERIRLSLLMLLRLRLRLEREGYDYTGVVILATYLQLAAQILQEISAALSPLSPPAPQEPGAHPAIEKLGQFANQLREEVAATPPTFLVAVAKEAVFQMDALGGQLRTTLDLAHDRAAATVTGEDDVEAMRHRWREALADAIAAFRGSLNLQSSVFRHAVRLAIMVALGEIVGRSVSWRRSYWLPMTIVLVLKPEFTATFTRGFLRIAGTVVGLLLATGLFDLFHPGVALQLVLVFVFVYLLRWVGPANYGIFGIVISAVIVLLLAITGVAPKDAIWARGLNTIAGGTLALLAYAVWPTWERTRVSERIAQMLDAYRAYMHALAEYRPCDESSRQELERTRRGARIGRANLQASIDRLSAEPGTTSEQISRLNAVLASSHRLIHAVMALDAIASRDANISFSAPLKNYIAAVEETLTLLASQLRGVRIPSKHFPNLREEYRLMVQARSPQPGAPADRFDSINIETDRITNSVNTLAEQVNAWTYSPEFKALYKTTSEVAPE
jgi:uncharacterized membrane protein YccC